MSRSYITRGRVLCAVHKNDVTVKLSREYEPREKGFLDRYDASTTL